MPDCQVTHEHLTDGFRLNGCFVDQHDRNVILNRIHPVARAALQRSAALHQLDGSLAVGTRQNFEQLGVDGHARTIAFCVKMPLPMRITHAAFISVGAALFLTLPRPAAAQTSAEAYYEFLIARHFEAQGDAKGAQAALEKGVAADPKSAEVRAELAAFFLRRDAADDAERVAKEALQLDDANSEAHRVLGMLYAARSEDTGRGQAAQAAAAELVKQGIAHLERVTENPAGLTDLNLQYTLGRLYTRAGQTDKAIQALTRVVNENPLSVQGRLALAQAYVAARDMNNAITALEEIVDDEPRVANMLGQFQEQAGRLKDAADSYTKALSVAPNSRELKVRRIAALLGAKDIRTRRRLCRTGADAASR